MSIDALVAERVMGWKWCEKLLCWVPPGPNVTLADTFSRKDFCPSTDMNHAIMARNKVLAENLDWDTLSIFRHGMLTEVSVCCTRRMCVISTGEHENEPYAICLAVLRANGVSEEEIQRNMR